MALQISAHFRKVPVSRADVVLIPTALSGYFGCLDLLGGLSPLWCLVLAAMAICVLRTAVAILFRPDSPGLVFAAAPLAVLFQLQWLPRTPAAIAALGWILITPFLIATLLQRGDRWIRIFSGFVFYPIVIAAYPLALLGIQSMPHLDFFEDGHELLPASEMFRGERPYVDTVPVHGLLSDGGLAFFLMRGGYQSAGQLLIARRIVGSLNLVGMYALAVAATGVPEVGLLASFLSVALFPSATISVRGFAALFALALAISAVRRRSTRSLFAAGMVVVIAFLFGMEFAMYSGIVAVVVLLRWSSSDRSRAWISFAAGVLALALPLMAVFATFDFLPAMFRVMFCELLPAGRRYMPQGLPIPECMRSFRSLLLTFSQEQCLAVVTWLVAVPTSIGALLRSRRMRRSDGPWYIGLWMTVAVVSFLQRHHHYFYFAMAAFMVSALWWAIRRGKSVLRASAYLLIIAVSLAARPWTHVFSLATPLRLAGGAPVAGEVMFTGTSRGDGALMRPDIAAALDSAHQFFGSTLTPEETFFDFSNSAAIYYFLDRDCPTRHHQVPFYQTTAGQQEVIKILERNQTIRAALLDFPGGLAIDGVPNRNRAPAVWTHLKRNFSPAFAENGVVIWLRNPSESMP